MKRVLLWTGLFLAGLIAGLEIGWLAGFFKNGPVSNRTPETVESRSAVTITISAMVDGSERFIFTAQGIQHEHGQWGPMKNVMFNDEPWPDLTQPPPVWTELGPQLDLARAAITERTGRDSISLEHTPEGFDLFFADTQMGAGRYAVSISIPRK